MVEQTLTLQKNCEDSKTNTKYRKPRRKYKQSPSSKLTLKWLLGDNDLKFINPFNDMKQKNIHD